MTEHEPERTGRPEDSIGPVPLASAGLAEFVGTFVLVLVGTAVATAASLGDNIAGPAYDSLSIALSFGLALIAVVGAIGHVSGAHVNPAVTVGLALAGAFPWSRVPVYVVAQIAGAVLASLFVWAAYGADAYVVAHLGAPSPINESTGLQVLLVEGAIAFILVFVVLSVTTDDRAPQGIAPIAVGFALAAGVLLSGPVSGGAGNPARALGPMIVGQVFSLWYLYAAGPVLGAAVAGLVHKAVVRRR